MDKGKLRINLVVERPKESTRGFEATVDALRLDGTLIHRDGVKLWSSTSRKAFAGGCIEALNGDLPPREAQRIRKWINEELIKREKELKSNAQKGKPKSAMPSNSKPKKMSKEKKDDAHKVLRDPALLFNIGQTLHRLGLAGETIIALILYLVLTSRLLQRIISAAIKSESSAGKSFILETVLKLFPPEAYKFMSSMSRQALIYSNEDYRHLMIIVAEATGAEAASYNFRTLLSENKLVFETVEKNPRTGQQETRRIEKQGPTGLITTTTLPRLHPENETRLVTLSLDESEDQSLAIKLATASEYEGNRVEPNINPWVNAQRLLRPVRVEIPYATYLAEHTPNKPLRIRRDFAKLLAIVEASAVLHQLQRKEIRKGVIKADLKDYFVAKTLMENFFFASLYGIHPNTKKLMEAIKVLDQQKNQKQKNQKGHTMFWITTDDLMDHLDWSKSKITRWAKPLDDFGWVESEGRGNRNHYHPGKEVGVNHPPLPSVEKLAERFPGLAGDFKVVHPLTGDVITLQNDGLDLHTDERALATRIKEVKRPISLIFQ